jgi:TRAP-type C4-dicarboxylate transport system substrate-binding protein
MKKRFFITTLIAVMTALLLVSAAHAKPVKWKLSHHRPLGTPIDLDMQKFAADVKKATEGRVIIEVFPAAQLGGSDVVMERVGMGSIEMMLGYPTSALDPRLEVYGIPAIAKNYKELQKLMTHGAPFMNILHKTFADSDIHTLASYPVGFVGLSFKKPIPNMLDPKAKHKEKVRTATLNSFRYPAEALGYLATPIPMGDLFTALQTGIVDGSYGNGPEVIYLQYRDVVKCFVHIKAQADVFFLIVNKDAFEDLDKKDREAITKIAAKLEKNRFAEAAADEEEWLNKLDAKGTKVYRLSDAQVDSFHKVIQDYSWPKLRSSIGAKFFDSALKARDESLKK